MKKKLIAITLAVVMVFAIASVASAGNGGYTVRMNGNGNNTRIQVLYNGSVVHTSAARPANNAWYQVTLESGSVVAVFVRGNSVDTVNITPPNAPNTPGGDDVSVSGPNSSSGGQGVQRIGNVEIRGNGSSARIWINNQNTGVRPANNTYTTIEFAGYTIEVFVRGNAILRWNAVEEECDEPYVVDTITRDRYVRSEQIDSLYEGTEEVAGSRVFVGGSVNHLNWLRANQNNPDMQAFMVAHGVNFTGNSVLVGATVTGTLEYEYNKNWLEQFERWYVTDTYNVYSDGSENRISTGAEWLNRVDDGDEYYTEYKGSRAVNASSGTVRVLLHMGGGQSDCGLFGETATLTFGAFTVNFRLTNTGNDIANTVITIGSYDVYEL